MNFDTKLFLDALTMPVMLQGAAIAILLSILVQVASFLLCLPLAVALNSMAAVRRTAAQLYVWLFRSSPLILVLLIVWNGAPQLFPGLTRAPWYTPFAAAFIAFTLVTTAYMAEAMRGALAAIGQGRQMRHARSGSTACRPSASSSCRRPCASSCRCSSTSSST